MIRDQPESPPSAIASLPTSEQSFKDSFKEMWANKNFLILAVAYAIIYGVYCATGATMSNLLNPFGYSPSDISIAGGSGLLAGVVAALCIGCFLDYTSTYRKTHISTTVLTLISGVVFTLILILSDNQSLGQLTFGLILFCMATISFFPTSLSYGAELTFPLQPALVNATMNFMGQLCAFALMGISTFITDVDATDEDFDALPDSER